jgi:hypothetical protein
MDAKSLLTDTALVDQINLGRVGVYPDNRVALGAEAAG